MERRKHIEIAAWYTPQTSAKQKYQKRSHIEIRAVAPASTNSSVSKSSNTICEHFTCKSENLCTVSHAVTVPSYALGKPGLPYASFPMNTFQRGEKHAWFSSGGAVQLSRLHTLRHRGWRIEDLFMIRGTKETY